MVLSRYIAGGYVSNVRLYCTVCSGKRNTVSDGIQVHGNHTFYARRTVWDLQKGWEYGLRTILMDFIII
jgi:hypothetical protein